MSEKVINIDFKLMLEDCHMIVIDSLLYKPWLCSEDGVWCKDEYDQYAGLDGTFIPYSDIDLNRDTLYKLEEIDPANYTNN